jgi:DnaK suppressor protein
MEKGQVETSSGLSAAELENLRERLERLQAELRARLGREQTTARESDRVSEPMDAAEQTREQDDAVTFSERDRALLAEVEHALAKLKSGAYGVSELSGEPIGFDRLQAIPWARYAADEAEDRG